MERVCDSVLVLCAPDGVSVVGTIVVGASVGDDVVGASVGVAAAHTTASSSLQRRRLLPPTARYPEYPYRPVWCAMGTPWFRREPLEDAHASSGYPVEYRARLFSADRVALACNVHRVK